MIRLHDDGVSIGLDVGSVLLEARGVRVEGTVVHGEGLPARRPARGHYGPLPRPIGALAAEPVGVDPFVRLEVQCQLFILENQQ